MWLKTLSKGVYRIENPAINNAFMEKIKGFRNSNILTEEGIDISYPQVVINQPSTKTVIKTTKKDKKDADEFLEDQKELSNDYEEQHQ